MDMMIEQVKNVVEGVTDIEEIKTNLQLIGVEWKCKNVGRSEVLTVMCDDGSFRIKKGGRICRA